MKIIQAVKTAIVFLFVSIAFMRCNKTNTTLSDNQLAVTAISPSSGNGNTVVKLSGKGFSLILTDDTVRFNGKAAVITQSTDSTITAYAPAVGSTGTVTVSVNGQQATGPIFSYLVSVPLLSITGINPASGQAGIQVTITGTQFVADTSKNIVYFNGVRAPVVSAGTTQIVVIVPNSTTGAVTVTVNGNSATGPVFTYMAPVPVITSAVYNGVFNIGGQHFGPSPATVTIGGQIVTGFNYSNPGNGLDELSRTNYVPPTNLDNPAAITVTVSNQTSAPYSFLFYPVISSISPDTVSDNETVIISGRLFGNRTLASTVRAFYLDAGGNKIYMAPDPTIVSWNTNTIQITMKDYGSYPIGSGGQVFYLEVNVGGKTTNASVRFHIT
jgi:hypothetical protein